jgi:hypothetical protein
MSYASFGAPDAFDVVATAQRASLFGYGDAASLIAKAQKASLFGMGEAMSSPLCVSRCDPTRPADWMGEDYCNLNCPDWKKACSKKDVWTYAAAGVVLGFGLCYVLARAAR